MLHSIEASTNIFIFQFYPNLSVSRSVFRLLMGFNHVILITDANLDYFVYKNKKSQLKFTNESKKRRLTHLSWREMRIFAK